MNRKRTDKMDLVWILRTVKKLKFSDISDSIGEDVKSVYRWYKYRLDELGLQKKPKRPVDKSRKKLLAK